MKPINILIFLAACAACAPKDENGPTSLVCNLTSQIQIQGSTVVQTNGACSPIYTDGTITPTPGNTLQVQKVTMCGQDAGILYKGLLYNEGIIDPTTPTGLLVWPDNCFVFPDNPAHLTSECWYKITGGKIDAYSSPPNF